MINGLQIITYGDGRFGLTIMEPGGPDADYWAIFEEQELQGGGYTWQPLVESLVRLHMPDAVKSIEVGAEADNAYVDSTDREVLVKIAALIERAIADSQVLSEAIDNAEDIE